MSRAWDSAGWARWVATELGHRTAVDLIADATDVDYMPPVNPDAERTVTISVRLLGSVFADVISDRDRARGERGLLAPAGSPTAARADAHETHWRALHPGYAELIDRMHGGEL